MDTIVIGGGPAGMTAALYAARGGMQVLLLVGSSTGGQLGSTPQVENYPGIPFVTGWELAERIEKQVTEHNVTVLTERATKLCACDDGWSVRTDKATHTAPTVILANGVRRRKLDCPGEERLIGKGVSYCAVCDGAFFRGKSVAVVGGGNTALEDALYLASLCREVYLVHWLAEFQAEQHYQDAIRKVGNIRVLTEATVSEICGEQNVTGLRVSHAGSPKELTVDGIFIAIGLVPDNGAFSDVLPLNEYGYVAAGEDCTTGVPGVFVAGDTRTKPLRQIVTAVADGAVAATRALEYWHTKK